MPPISEPKTNIKAIKTDPPKNIPEPRKPPTKKESPPQEKHSQPKQKPKIEPRKDPAEIQLLTQALLKTLNQPQQTNQSLLILNTPMPRQTGRPTTPKKEQKTDLPIKPGEKLSIIS